MNATLSGRITAPPALCARTLCLYRPGQQQPGVVCVFAYTGRIPCTGPRLCMTCGGRGADAHNGGRA